MTSLLRHGTNIAEYYQINVGRMVGELMHNRIRCLLTISIVPKQVLVNIA